MTLNSLRSLDTLAAVLATARTGNPAKAAQALACAPSSIYRAIDRLEADVAAPLFKRSASGWKPTPTGRAIIELGEQVDAHVIETERTLGALSRGGQTPLRLSASDSFAAFLAPALVAFSGSPAGAPVELVVENSVVDLLRREADVAIRPEMQPGDALVGQRAGKLAHALYGARSLLVRNRMPETVADLATLPLCALSPSMAHFTAVRWWHEAGFEHRARLYANTETALAGIIASGGGIGILPRFVGDQLDGVLRIPRITVGEPVDIWLVTRPSLRENPSVRSLIRALASHIRGSARLFSGRP